MKQVVTNLYRSTGRLASGALLAAALLNGGMAVAQGLGPVTLVFDDGQGGGNLSGTLTEFDGDRFMLDSPIGLVAIPAAGVSCIGAGCPAGTEPAGPAPEVSSPVLVLTSLDGQSVVRGSLLDYVDETYVLETDVGEIRIPAIKVSCEGRACVTPAAVTGQIGGPATLTGGGMSIEGTMLSADDGTYVLAVVGFGELRVPIGEYDCEGPGCP